MQSILLIDDSKFMNLANARTLAKAGYQVLTAADGEEALRIAHNTPLDLVLLDMMLPKMSGPEVLSHLKTNSATALVPVIILTGLSKKNEEKLRKAGAFAFLQKEHLLDTPQLLLDAVGSALLKKGANDETLEPLAGNATVSMATEAQRNCDLL